MLDLLMAMQAQTDWPFSEAQARRLLPLLGKAASEGTAKVTARTEGMLAVLAGLRLAQKASQQVPEVCAGAGPLLDTVTQPLKSDWSENAFRACPCLPDADVYRTLMQ